MNHDLFRGLSRRHFLRASASATLAAMTAGESRLLAQDKPKLTPKADTLILLWMAGGMAQTETFDPKRYTPYATGLESNLVLSTFPPIDTAVGDIKNPQGLGKIPGGLGPRGLLPAPHTAALGLILHSRH